MTNEQRVRERIAAMTTEELVVLINNLDSENDLVVSAEYYCRSDDFGHCPSPGTTCEDCIAAYLREEVKI